MGTFRSSFILMKDKPSELIKPVVVIDKNYYVNK